jgi:hypothetical protein
MDSSQPAPSGSFLPYFLRKKWKIQNGESSAPEASTEQYPEMTRAEKSRIMHRVFSAQEIEDRMQQISKVVLVEIQKQIHKGEEAYFEETNGHGNLFRGWDAFVDSKEIGATGASSVPQGTKRIPADCRWFSMSSRRPLKPARSNAVPVKLSPPGQPSLETSSTSGTAERSSSTAIGNVVPMEQAPQQPETTTSITETIVKKESVEIQEDPVPVKTELPITEDKIPSVPEPKDESKRKHQEIKADQGTNENNERKKKRSREETGEEKTTEVATTVDDDRTAEVKSSAIETTVGHENNEAHVDEPDQPKKKASHDQAADQKGTEETRTESLKSDDKTKREEPQKRRSSRNRRSS